MPEIIDTARGTNNILANRVVVNMSETISQLEPSATPLIVLTEKMGKKVTTNYKFEWMEDELMSRDVLIGADALANATTIILKTGEGALVAVNDLLKVVATGEIMKVTAIAGDSLTVVRGYGETTTAAALTTNDKVLVMANAIMQGAGAPGEKYNNPTPVFNYTQIFRTPFSVTNTLNSTKLYGEKELAILRKKKAIEHAKSIELAYLFGERKLDVTGSQPVSTTRGILKFLATSPSNISKAKADFVEADLDAFCEDIFRYGSGSRVVLSGAAFISKVNTWAKSKLQVISTEKKYGLNIMKYVTPFGELVLIKHPLLVGAYDGYAIALDMEELSARPLVDRDTKLKTNIQNNDEDGERDEYITEIGLELRQIKKHGLIILT